MTVRIVSFPRWETVADHTRTIFHLPLKIGPKFKLGDWLVCVPQHFPVLDDRQAVVARITSIKIGPLMSFIGDPDNVVNRGYTKELGAVGCTWDAFDESWRAVRGESPRVNPEVMRCEFKYEPLPLSEEAVKALEESKELLEPTGNGLITALLVANAHLEVQKQEDGEFAESLRRASSK
jgi:hypothetical protein